MQGFSVDYALPKNGGTAPCVSCQPVKQIDEHILLVTEIPYSIFHLSILQITFRQETAEGMLRSDIDHVPPVIYEFKITLKTSAVLLRVDGLQ
jgi:hypothetical protein